MDAADFFRPSASAVSAGDWNPLIGIRCSSNRQVRRPSRVLCCEPTLPTQKDAIRDRR